MDSVQSMNRNRPKIPGAVRFCHFKLWFSRGNGCWELEVSILPGLGSEPQSLLISSIWSLLPSLTQVTEPGAWGQPAMEWPGAAVLLVSSEPFGCM